MTETEAGRVIDMLRLCGELDGIRKKELPHLYLRRLIDGLILAEHEIARLRAENERLRAALKDIADGYHGGETAAVQLQEIAQAALEQGSVKSND